MLPAAICSSRKSNQSTYLVAALASLDVNDFAHDAEAAVDGSWRRRDGKDKGKVVSISAEVVVWSSYFLERPAAFLP